MKPSGVRALPFFLLLALALVVFPAALSAISVFDVIRLTQEKYSDREIIRIIQLTDSRFALKADDTSRLKKEGVPESVIREMLSRPASDKTGIPPSQTAAKPSRSSASTRDSAKDVSRNAAGSAPSDVSTPSRQPAAILDEIVRLTKAGLADETVLAYAKAHRGELPAVLPNDRLNWLRDSGVSRNVILYLTAIDVRASADSPPESTYYESDEAQNAPQTAPAEPPPSSVYPPRDYAYDEGQYDSGYADGGSYPVDPGYGGDGGYYPPSDYVSYYSDPGYWGGYPYYGGWYWPSYFFVDVSGCFGRNHWGHGGHGHGGHGDGHGHWSDGGHGGGGHGDGDHRGGGGGGVGGGNGAGGQSWRDRPALARDSFSQGSRQPRESVARGGQGGSSIPSRGLNQASRGSFGGPRTVTRPGYSSRDSAASMTRGPIGRAGRSPGTVSRPGYSGGIAGGGGRAPIARSGGSYGGGRSGGYSGGMGGGGGRAPIARSGGFSGGGGGRSGGFSSGGGRSGGFSGGGMRSGGGGGGGRGR